MTSLRSSARLALLFCAFLFVCMSVAPSGAMAKVFKVEGQDGAAGDPGDGLDSIGGGGSTVPFEQTLDINVPSLDPPEIVFVPIITVSWLQVGSNIVFEVEEFVSHWINSGGPQ